jgi:hypothetical protein
MRTFRVHALISVIAGPAMLLGLAAGPVMAQASVTVPSNAAVDAALNMANILDGAGGASPATP